MIERECLFSFTDGLYTPFPFSIRVPGFEGGVVPDETCDLETFRYEVRRLLSQAFSWKQVKLWEPPDTPTGSET